MKDKLPMHVEARKAKKIDVFNRMPLATKAVYLDKGEETISDREIVEVAFSVQVPENEEDLQLYFGDLHNHTCFSDGSITPEELLDKMQERVDFCALTDHDHGGLWKDTLYTDKWKQLNEIVQKRYIPGKFTPFIGYERDSYPWYDNMIIYFSDYKHLMLQGAVRGETNAEELSGWLDKEDVFISPHDTTLLSCSTDFTNRPLQLMPHGFEIISRGNCGEYFNHPLNVYSSVRGGSYQDALATGAHFAVIGSSDSHGGTGACDLPKLGFPRRYPGMTGVWAKSNTLEAIFEALKMRRTYAFMGPKRIRLDFRVNGQIMGACIKEPTDASGRYIYYSVESEEPLVEVTVVKNNVDYFVSKGENIERCSFVDYECQQQEDWYYLRVKLADGRQAWTSPCWVRRE